MAAKAADALLTFLLRDVCEALAIKDECVGTDPPTPRRAESGSEWKAERLGGCTQRARKGSEGERDQNKPWMRQEVKTPPVDFFRGKKEPTGQRLIWGEGSPYDLTHMEFLGRSRPGKGRGGGCRARLIMRVAAENPRGIPFLFQRCTQTLTFLCIQQTNKQTKQQVVGYARYIFWLKLGSWTREKFLSILNSIL